MINEPTCKILIAGIGAVGGYFGGLLAGHFENDHNTEIYFLSRGQNLEKIKRDGIEIRSATKNFIAHPAKVSDNAKDFGKVDLIILCVKSFDLEETIEQLKPCLSMETYILPLLNGADSKKRIQEIVPEIKVLEGCVYIVSRLKEPGIIENSGNIQSLFWGDKELSDDLIHFETLFNEAGIEATLTSNISSIVWEKFIFIAPTATATSYFDCSIGEILSHPDRLNTLTSMIDEVKQIALSKNIPLFPDITQRTLEKLRSLPYEATSSMHSDFKNKKAKNELVSLTGFVVREAKNFGLKAIDFETAYEQLKNRK